jgi:hypothetical protein
MHRSRNEMSESALSNPQCRKCKTGDTERNQSDSSNALLRSKNATATSPYQRSRYENGLFWSNSFLEFWRSPILGAINYELRDFEYHQ